VKTGPFHFCIGGGLVISPGPGFRRIQLSNIIKALAFERTILAFRSYDRLVEIAELWKRHRPGKTPDTKKPFQRRAFLIREAAIASPKREVRNTICS
jgi:hypothetical protein